MPASGYVTTTGLFRDILVKVLAIDDPTVALTKLAQTRMCEDFFPEFGALKMENDFDSSFKEVFSHTLAVVARTRNEPTLRLAALFHDIAKPATFARRDGKVTFHYHEVLGAKMTQEIMERLDFHFVQIERVVRLVRLHLRGHTSDKWSDSAVRRYVRDAGDDLGLLQELQRADCTTRNPKKAARLVRKMDNIERRIAEVAEKDARNARRPPLTGQDVMRILNISPGPRVGKVLRSLMEENVPVDEAESWVLKHFRFLADLEAMEVSP